MASSSASSVSGSIFASNPYDPARPAPDLPPWIIAAAIAGVALIALVVGKK